MEKSSNLFIKIDEFIFQKLDALKSEGFFQKFNDALANLDENQQRSEEHTSLLSLPPPFLSLSLSFLSVSSGGEMLKPKKDLKLKSRSSSKLLFLMATKQPSTTSAQTILLRLLSWGRKTWTIE